MVRIPGGTFEMGALDADTRARPCERPRHPVTLRPFYLDRHEVTVAAYAEAVRAGAVPPPVSRAENDWQAALANWNRPDRTNHPVNGVTWDMAAAYARWAGKRLPTEAELEYVLRAGRADAIYPWGNDRLPPPAFGNYAGDEAPPQYAHGRPLRGYRDDWVQTAPVGSFPANAFGLYDVSGNIWEWCSDWFAADAYGPAPVTNPAGPAQGVHRVLKGGNFHCVPEELRISERHHKPATDGSVFSGFRCAMDLDAP